MLRWKICSNPYSTARDAYNVVNIWPQHHASITSLCLFLELLYIVSSLKSSLTEILKRTHILDSKTFFLWKQFCHLFQLQQEQNGVHTCEKKFGFAGITCPEIIP